MNRQHPGATTRVIVHLDEDGELTYEFYWEIVEARTGHKRHLTGTYRIGDSGVEILSLVIGPPANEQLTDTETAPPITSSTLRELRISTLKAGIAAGIEQTRQIAQRAADTLAQMRPDDYWDEAEKNRQLHDWRTVEAGLETPTVLARRKPGGRPPATPDVWANRAETTLTALANRQPIYEAHGALETVDRETIKTWLRRMRQPYDSNDPRTGWLLGSGAGTMPGPRLLAWRTDNP